MIYLDNNASTAPLREVRAAVGEALAAAAANPAAGHAAGRAARRAVEGARASVAALVGAAVEEVTLVSGGTEANAMALGGAFLARRAARPVIVIGATEHPSVAAAAQSLASHHGAEVRVVAVDGAGRPDLDALGRLVDERTALVSIMLANNITGVLADLSPVIEVARRRGALVHSDAVQAPGRIPIQFSQVGLDLMSISAHKLHGPQGAGALVCRTGVELEPLVPGGGQERGLRGGTENVPGLVGFGAAADAAVRDLAQVAPALCARRDRLELGLRASWPGLQVQGEAAARLPNTSCVTFPGVDGEALLAALDASGVAVSAGSACHRGASGPAPQLLALGLTPLEAQATLRFSLSRFTTDEEVDAAVRCVRDALEQVAAAPGAGAAGAARPFAERRP